MFLQSSDKSKEFASNDPVVRLLQNHGRLTLLSIQGRANEYQEVLELVVKWRLLVALQSWDSWTLSMESGLKFFQYNKENGKSSSFYGISQKILVKSGGNESENIFTLFRSWSFTRSHKVSKKGKRELYKKGMGKKIEILFLLVTVLVKWWEV